jgi:hypothetical protein
MNLCNYARIDKSQEAREYIEANAPKSFLIDKLALRTEKGDLVWKVELF